MVTASLDWLQTLADVTRVRLLKLLQQGELSVSELCSVVQLPQSTVSRHLKVLASSGWIANRRDGTNQLYRMEREHWCDARDELWGWVRARADSPTLKQDEQRLREVLSQRSRSEAFFSDAAGHWERLRTELFGDNLDSLALAAGMHRDWVVAELGCGSAPLCKRTAPYVKKAYAIDNSAAMLTASRIALSEFENVKIVEASLTQLPLESESIDVAWLVMVLPYLEQPCQVLAEAQRILKKERPLVIVDLCPHERSIYRQEMGHLRLGVERDELSAWTEQAGLELAAYHHIAPDPHAKGPALFSAVAYALRGD